MQPQFRIDRPLVAIADPWHDTSYAVFDGDALRHVEVERHTRAKYEELSALVAIALREPLLLDQAATVLVGEGRLLARVVRAVMAQPSADADAQIDRILTEQAGSIPVEVLKADAALRAVLRRFCVRLRSGDLAVEFFDHHYCHAANAFLGSGFERAVSVTLDGGGEHVIGGRAVFVHGEVHAFDRARPVENVPLAQVQDWSAGWAWRRGAELLGYGANDAGTVMAMAAFGSCHPAIDALIRHDRFWRASFWDLPRLQKWRLERHLAKLQSLLVDDAARHALAWSLQTETERRIRDYLAPWLSGAEPVDVCLSGGVFLNCIAAAKVQAWFPAVRRVHIPPAPYDGGLSIGMVQIHLARQGIDPFAGHTMTPFGCAPRSDLVDVLAAARAVAGRDPVRTDVAGVAAALDAGAVVAIFQGAAESGRRALGNRSILADPRDPAKKDHLNRIVKKRQWFRPFAPMILAERVGDWFEVTEGFESPYMSFAVRFRDGQGLRVPAVCHADGTARVQTVHAGLTALTHRLLTQWERISGVPILLNTSFNDSEPIVETPAQAVATMLRSGIDAVYFGDHDLLLVNPNGALADPA